MASICRPAARSEKRCLETWKMIFTRSKGASTVFAVAPASAPDTRCAKKRRLR